MEMENVTILCKPTKETHWLDHPDANSEDSCEFQANLESVPKEHMVCGRCRQNTEDLFDNDSCDHGVCTDCRFKDSVQCMFCTNTKHEEAGTDNSLLDYYFKKKLINKDHIIDVHEDSSTIAPRQKCTICQRVFLKTNARYHYACASGERPLECSECGKRFVKKSHLESHLNSHFGIKPFKCTAPKCKASFTQKDKLVRHMKTHNSEKHMCPVCDKVYSSVPILHFHMQRVHSTDKLFKCDKCPRTYKYQRTLTVHRLKHQGLKEHMCDVCGKKYAVTAQLKQHKRSHIPISKRPYKCRRHCKQRFITRHDKARHELIHDHTSSPDFECSLCNTTFRRKDNLERHMKNFHQEPWNLGKPIKKTAVVSPRIIKKPNLDSNISVKFNKTNKSEKKYKKKSQKDVTDSCKKEIKEENLSKITTNITKKLPFHHVKEGIEKFKAINSKETLNQTDTNQAKSVIVRPSVIKIVPKLLPVNVNSLDVKCQKTVDNLTNQSVMNTTLDVNSANSITDKITSIISKNFNSYALNCQKERKDILKSSHSTLNRCCKTICHTNSLKATSTRASAFHYDNHVGGQQVDNLKSVIYGHCDFVHGNVSVKRDVQTSSMRTRYHPDKSLHQNDVLPIYQNNTFVEGSSLPSRSTLCASYTPLIGNTKGSKGNVVTGHAEDLENLTTRQS